MLLNHYPVMQCAMCGMDTPAWNIGGIHEYWHEVVCLDCCHAIEGIE